VRSANLGVILVAASVGTAPAAFGGAPPLPPDRAAVAQYIEQIPTSRGNTQSGTTAPPAPGAKLTAKNALKVVATSPALGAPRHRLLPAAKKQTPPSVLSASVTSLGAGGTTRMIGLLTAIVLASAGCFGAAARRRRRAPDHPRA